MKTTHQLPKFTAGKQTPGPKLPKQTKMLHSHWSQLLVVFYFPKVLIVILLKVLILVPKMNILVAFGHHWPR